jgi:DSF synthase
MNAIADVRFLHQPKPELIETRFDKQFGAYWAFMKPRTRACFSQQLLAELSQFVDSIENGNGALCEGSVAHSVRYAIIASKTPNVFNLGGDLELFRAAIVRRDRAQLVHYGRACVDTLFRWWNNCNLPLTTISLVQGDALGGGFECALSSSVIIAERSARMGFPEILFNLFPGMGAYSFLSRKVGKRVTEELITSGTIYSAEQLFEMGVVDELCSEGAGEAAVETFIRKHAKAGNGRRGVEALAREMQPLKLDELTRIVDLWADAALRLEERDLRMMDRLVRAQDRQRPVLHNEQSNVVRLEAMGQ